MRLGDVLRDSPCHFSGHVTARHVNAVHLDAVGDAGADALLAQLLHLRLKVLAEDVVDQRVVYGGALRKHARQETDLGRDGATVLKDGPHTHQAVRQPAAYEAYTNQHGNLQRQKKDRLSKISVKNLF